MDTVLMKLASELPALTIYLISLWYVLRQATDIFKYWIDRVSIKEDRILNNESSLLTKMTELEIKMQRCIEFETKIESRVNYISGKIKEFETQFGAIINKIEDN